MRTVSQKVEACSQQDVELHVEQVSTILTDLCVLLLQYNLSKETILKKAKKWFSRPMIA